MPGPLTALATPPRADRRSRVAGMTPSRARLALAGLAVALLLGSIVGTAGDGPAVGEQSAAAIQSGLIGAVQNGGDYYVTATEAWRAADRPTDLFTTPLPTLTVIAAVIPQRLLTMALWLLAIVTVAAWYRRLAPSPARGLVPVAAALLPLAGAAAVVLRPEAALVREGWAGLCVALSLAVRRPGRTIAPAAPELIAPAALGLIAALLDQVAGCYLLVMLFFAIGERRRGEAWGWVVTLGVFAVVIGCHAQAVIRAGGHGSLPGDAVRANVVAAIRAMADASLSRYLPPTLAGPLLMLALIGWIAQRGGSAARVAAVLIGGLLLVGSGAAADAGETALLIAPLSLTGLIFAAQAIRDLVVAALDTRRITVTRIVR